MNIRIHNTVHKFAKSRAFVSKWSTCQSACMSAWFTCQRVRRMSTFHFYVPTFQTVCQFFKLTCKRTNLDFIVIPKNSTLYLIP